MAKSEHNIFFFFLAVQREELYLKMFLWAEKNKARKNVESHELSDKNCFWRYELSITSGFRELLPVQSRLIPKSRHEHYFFFLSEIIKFQVKTFFFTRHNRRINKIAKIVKSYLKLFFNFGNFITIHLRETQEGKTKRLGKIHQKS